MLQIKVILSVLYLWISQKLLLAKLKAFGFSKDALTLMCSYLKNCKQRVVIIALAQQKYLFQNFYKNLQMLFNTFLNDLVLFMQYTILDNYFNGNNISISGNNEENFKKLLLWGIVTLTEWFNDNYMIINLEKYSYMCLGKNQNDNEFNLKNSKEEAILGIKINLKLTSSVILKLYVQKQV